MKFWVENNVLNYSGDWPKSDSACIKAAIKKWKALAKEHKIGVDYIYRYHSESCALCMKYVIPNESCDGCPIKNKTQKKECRKTPYIKYVLATDWISKLKYANKMVEFLENLL